MAQSESTLPLVALSGASGFVGTHLRRALADDCRFRALTRSPSILEANPSTSATEWRQCDLYSLPQLTSALQGCDIGVYLVHSMAPSSRLMQGNFEDTDLLLADNFIRAAERAGLRHVIYLSGLMPPDGDSLSPHLRSRREVEAVLRSRSVNVTVLRAGLIFGAGGSSFSMLVNLVRRLPVMILPDWAGSLTQSIDVQDICAAIKLAMTESAFASGTYDLGGHQPMTYGELIHATARGLGRRVRSIDVPFNLFTLSQHWVALFGGVPLALVGPLQESLRHDLSAQDNPLLDRLRPQLVPLAESLRRAVDADGHPLPNPRSTTQRTDRQKIRRERRVRSVQRMPLPTGWDAAQVCDAYGTWLTRRFGGIVSATQDSDGVLHFRLARRWVLLELTPTPHSHQSNRRRAYHITGGLLARRVTPPGRFEFRLFPETQCLIASIHGFSPALPWWLYARTQAVVHLWVMRAFGRHLGRQV
ncbi:NAD(P)H-binding protein [Synoicihabitans lomoniglobus]|uniref:NAD(P)H-binding protein n=1 Tax=Synoicihabitans lomoniglobus TaxID=2909285 RepID=A0AAE9ZZE5_9BACT|nr:NAD(P)H-binding protein [Opitutaceae bacterium LMO-M01]WED63352.1 NAD(P)H-binding protein [Opitutaceae bacterium LMO-M01]